MMADERLIRIQIVDPRLPEFRAMLQAGEEYGASLYPAESNHYLNIEAMCKPEMHFFGVFVKDVALGCGGFWAHNGYVEIKRLWVSPSARGLGLSHKLMNEIETLAKRKGFSVARLETGISQPEAMALYEKRGYHYVAAFGDYKPDPLSVFMEKEL